MGNLTQLAALAIGGGWTVNKILNTPPVNAPKAKGPFRPPQWKKPQQTAITVNWPTLSVSSKITSVNTLDNGSTNLLSDGQSINTGQQVQFNPTTYYFDAIFRIGHNRRLQTTDHPIQTGAALSDHAYLLPKRVSLEIGMSDAMDAIVPGIYTSNASKSVSAYQTLVKIMESKLPIQVLTRLETYTNMLIESMDTFDDNKTHFGLRVTVNLKQIMLGTVATRTVAFTARPQTTNSTPVGAINPLPVPQVVQQTHQDSDGNWFSNVLHGLSSQLPTLNPIL